MDHYAIRRLEPDEAVARVFLAGEIDLSAKLPLAAALVAAVRALGVACVEVDLRDVQFIDCGALSAIIHARQTATEHGVDLYLTHVHGGAARVLKVLDLWELTTASQPASHAHR